MNRERYQRNLLSLREVSPETATALEGVSAEQITLEKVALPQAQVRFVLGVCQFDPAPGVTILLERSEEKLASWLAQVDQIDCYPYLLDEDLDRFVGRLIDGVKGLFVEVVVTEEFDVELARSIAHRILEETHLARAIVHEFARHGDLFYSNFYANLNALDGAVNGAASFGKFKGVPAFVCGAGPSLDRAIPHLKNGVILAAGSAYTALRQQGVTPHCAVAVDPHPTQVERLSQVAPVDTPFFYRSRWASDARALLRGKRHYLKGAGAYPIAEWFEQQLGIQGEILHEGQSVVHLATDLAYHLGCDPIIFVGLDLAFTNARGYAKGIFDSPDDKNGLEVKDIFGEPVRTLPKWIGEARWLADYCQHTGATFYNCTLGGLGINGVPNISIGDLALVPRTIPPFEEQFITDVTGALEEAKTVLRQSLRRCQHLLNSLKNNSNQPECVVDLEAELAYQLIIENTLDKSIDHQRKLIDLNLHLI